MLISELVEFCEVEMHIEIIKCLVGILVSGVSL